MRVKKESEPQIQKAGKRLISSIESKLYRFEKMHPTWHVDVLAMGRSGVVDLVLRPGKGPARGFSIRF